MTVTTAPMTETTPNNPVGLRGIAFIEFSGSDPAYMDKIFKALGFSKTMRHASKAIDLYQQNKIYFMLNRESAGFAAEFSKEHGQCACAMGFRVEEATFAHAEAIRRGAKAYTSQEKASYALPAIYGIGDSLIYFCDDQDQTFLQEFVPLESPEIVEDHGFLVVDHLTNNVYKGTMEHWSNFYKSIFGFTEMQYFDIKGEKTGLTSFALKSPCKTFSIPINEGNEDKSQIEEYLREYKGAGIQHIALLSTDLLASLDHMQGSVDTLDIEDSYYEEAFQRVPKITEDKNRIMKHRVLVDGDEKGYLLQIFTKNLFGPIFFEFIQRKNNQAFGEGNFGALFRTIERDQERRGVL